MKNTLDLSQIKLSMLLPILFSLTCFAQTEPPAVSGTANLILQFETDNGVLTSGSLINGWNDTSGFGSDYSFASLDVSGNPQLITTGTPSGLDYIQFDGIGDRLRRTLPTAADAPAGSNARTLFFVVNYRTAGNFCGFGYGLNSNGQNFGLVADTSERLAIDGWGGNFNEVSSEEGVVSKDFMVQSVVFDGANFKHYIYTAADGLELIDSGPDAPNTFDTNVAAGQLVMAGKPNNGAVAEMDVAAVLLYDDALTTGTNDLGGDHAAVSQYLYAKYLVAASCSIVDAGLSNILCNDNNTNENTNDDFYTFDLNPTGFNLGAFYTVSGATGISPTTGVYGTATTFTMPSGSAGAGDLTITITDNLDSGCSIQQIISDPGPCSFIDYGPFEFPTAGLVLHLEADDDNLTSLVWPDQSGSGNDLSSAGGPSILEGITPGGQSAVSFDGIDDKFQKLSAISGLPSGTSDRTMFIVIDYTQNTSAFAGVAYGNGATDETFGLVVNSGESLTVQGYVNDYASATDGLGDNDGSAGDDWFVQSVIMSNQQLNHYKDGTLIDGPRATTHNTNVQQIMLGAEIRGNDYRAMNIAAVLTYDRALSEIERQQVETYLQTKYFEANLNLTDGTHSITSDIIVDDLTLGNSATLIIEPGASIEVKGNLVNDGGIICNSNSTLYSSLISDDISGSGTIKYNRYVNSNTLGNDLIAPPLDGQTWNSFLTTDASANAGKILNNGQSPTTAYLFGPFEKGTIDDYILYDTNTSANLQPGRGYRAATLSGETLTFTGNLVTTNPLPVTITNETTGAFYEWNLIGNPYPSYISVAEFLNHEVSPGVKNLDLLEPVSTGVYGYNANTTGSVWTITNLIVGPKFLAPGQGFFVASQNASANLEFTPDMQVRAKVDDYILGRTWDFSAGFVKLQLANSNQTYTTDIHFHSAANDQLNPGYDNAIFGGIAPEFSIYSRLVESDLELPMAIQTLASTDMNDAIVPLGIRLNSGLQSTISIEELSLPSGIDVYLDDIVSNNSTLLNTTDYQFTPNATLDDYGRFYLRFENNALSIDDSPIGAIFVYWVKDESSLAIKGEMTLNTTLAIYDISGRCVLNTNLKTNSSLQYVRLKGLQKGIYITKIVNESGSNTQKIILN